LASEDVATRKNLSRETEAIESTYGLDVDPKFGVSAAAVKLLLDECRAAGVPTEQVLAVLGPATNGFHAWQDYLAACDVIAEIVGGHDAFSEMVDSTIAEVMPHVAQLLPIFAGPADFARFATNAMDASAFIGVRYEVCEQRPDKLVVRLHAQSGYTLTPALVAGVTGAYRAVTRPFGHGGANVQIATDATGANIRVRFPSSLVRAAAAAVPQGPAHAVNAMIAQHRQLLEAQHAMTLQLARAHAETEVEDRAARARKHWDLTDKETEVLVSICTGLTNKEIASGLGRAESTIELHVTRMLKKMGVTNRASLIARYFMI